MFIHINIEHTTFNDLNVIKLQVYMFTYVYLRTYIYTYIYLYIERIIQINILIVTDDGIVFHLQTLKFSVHNTWKFKNSKTEARKIWSFECKMSQSWSLPVKSNNANDKVRECKDLRLATTSYNLLSQGSTVVLKRRFTSTILWSINAKFRWV